MHIETPLYKSLRAHLLLGISCSRLSKIRERGMSIKLYALHVSKTNQFSQKVKMLVFVQVLLLRYRDAYRNKKKEKQKNCMLREGKSLPKTRTVRIINDVF